LTSLGGWMISSRIDPLAGRIDISLASTERLEGKFSGELVQLQATVRENAPAGGSAINLAATSRSRSTQLNEGFLTLIPAPTDAANDPIDGLLTITSRSTPPAGATARLVDNRLLVIGTNGDEMLLIKPTANGSQLIVRANQRILGTFSRPQSIAIDGFSGRDYVYVDPTSPDTLIATTAENESLADLEDLIFTGDNAALIDSPTIPLTVSAGQNQPLSAHDQALLYLLDQWIAGNEDDAQSTGTLRRRQIWHR
jgi:hypothetical protein